MTLYRIKIQSEFLDETYRAKTTCRGMGLPLLAYSTAVSFTVDLHYLKVQRPPPFPRKQVLPKSGSGRIWVPKSGQIRLSGRLWIVKSGTATNKKKRIFGIEITPVSWHGAGFGGTMCELKDERSACYNNPCLNGASCRLIGSLDNYTCLCPVGYRGQSITFRTCSIYAMVCVKGAITSKIKHAIKHKTSPVRLAQLLQPSLAFCFSLQPMTYRPGLNGTPSLAAS